MYAIRSYYDIRELRSMAYDAISRHEHGVLSMSSFLKTMDTKLESISIESITATSEAKIVFPEVLPTRNNFV